LGPKAKFNRRYAVESQNAVYHLWLMKRYAQMQSLCCHSSIPGWMRLTQMFAKIWLAYLHMIGILCE
jgi:hypothetical protein